MAFVTLRDGDRLYYEVHGDGPPLALVPGLSGVGSFWAPHLSGLSQRFKVVVYDHRGAGQSSRSRIDTSVEQMADDLVQLLDGLGIERTHLIGHSAGGAIGQTLAIERPERIGRLVLSATWTAADAYFRRLFEVRSGILRQDAAAYQRANALFFWPSWWVRDHLAELEAHEEPAVQGMPPAEIMLDRIEAILRFDRRADLPRITVPTLIIAARDDVVTPPYYSEQLGRLIPGAETIILPQGGHFFPRVYPQSYQKIVLEFLQRDRASAH
ncbi:MAG: alpha/beta fold hydrolase [Kiloniellales bacterium]